MPLRLVGEFVSTFSFSFFLGAGGGGGGRRGRVVLGPVQCITVGALFLKSLLRIPTSLESALQKGLPNKLQIIIPIRHTSVCLVKKKNSMITRTNAVEVMIVHCSF